jgi:arylsulfatase A-like enzyme
VVKRSLTKTSFFVVALVATVGGMLTASAQERPKKRPNILLIISDDIGLDATTDMYPGLIDGLLAQYGPKGRNHPNAQSIKGRPASTPNLNALAQAGMRFTQAWVQPFCANTRSAIISGLYPAKTGVIDYRYYLPQNHHSFVQDLKDKGGYSTAVFGKWHIAGLAPYAGMRPKEAGFDIYKGNLNGGVQTYWDWDYHVQDDTTPANQWRTERAPTRSLPGVAATTYAPLVNIADTIEWLTDQRKKDPNKPWFVWMASNLAHITGQQQPNPMAVPNIDTMDEKSIAEMKSCGGTFGSATVGRCTDKQLMRAMTNSLDTLVGMLLKHVDSFGQDTYVIYIGDNGTWMFGQNREFIDNMYITRLDRGKGTSYESGARVEMAIRGPGIKANSVSDAPVTGSDLYSTILNMAGLEPTKQVPGGDGKTMLDLDSVSLMPILLNGAKQIRDPNMGYLLAETTNPVKNNVAEAAARNERYKVFCIENAQPASCSFYDLQEDPLEEYPLAKPASCTDYQSGKLTPAAPPWHFCRLQEVVAKDSFLSKPIPPAPAQAGRGGGAAPAGRGGAAPRGGRGAPAPGARGARGPAPAPGVEQ